MESLLREQWAQLTGWLREVDAEARLNEASGLDDWNVGHLIGHLGFGIAMISEIEPAPAGTRPITIGQYISGYRAAAPTISEQTRQLKRRLGSHVLDGIDELAHSAWRSLDAVTANVVLGRRGALRLDDYLMTRLIELVVHGDDLHRALGGSAGSPVLDTALRAVSDTLAVAHLEAHGVRPDTQDSLAWIRQAAGRAASDGSVSPVLG